MTEDGPIERSIFLSNVLSRSMKTLPMPSLLLRKSGKKIAISRSQSECGVHFCVGAKEVLGRGDRRIELMTDEATERMSACDHLRRDRSGETV